MTTLTVGAGQQFTTIAAAVAAAQDGDNIQVSAGTYTNDFANISRSITIEGVGGPAKLVATQSPPNGKAILDVYGNVTLRNLDISGAAVPDQNGAGVRYEGGNLTIQNCSFHDNENGILANADLNGTITIDRSEFYNNGWGDGQTHNIYIGDIKQFTLTNSYIHDANVGHEVKSRAETNVITNNRIFDNGSTSSYSIDLPNGGDATITGNVIEQGPNGQNPTVIAYGEEGSLHVGRNVNFSGNTIVNDLTAYAPYLFWDASGVPVTASGNTVYGLQASQLDSNNSVSSSGFTFTSTRPTLDTSSPVASSQPAPTPMPTPTPTPTPAPARPAVTAKLANDTGSSSTDGITSDDSLRGSGDVGTAVTIKNGSTVMATTTAGSSGSWTVPKSALHLADGTYTLTASETDAAGNTGTANVTFTLDTKGPTPVVTQVVRNPNNTVTLSGTSEANSKVTLSDRTAFSTTTVGTATASNNGAWSVTSAAAINPTTINSYTASATDLAGNTGATVGKFLVSSSLPETLIGTTGQSDVFAFLPSFGRDMISGFETTAAAGANHDYIDLSGSNYSSFGALQSRITQGSAGAVIAVDNSNTITLAGVAANTLQASDFRFS